MYTLNTPIASLHGVGAKLSQQLQDAGIATVRDLVLFAPYRYEPRQHIVQIGDLLTADSSLFSAESNPEIVTVQAHVVRINQSWRGKQSLQRATIADETGQIRVNWFNSPYVVRQLKPGLAFNFSGKWSAQYRSLTQPTIEALNKGETVHTGRIVPIYSSSLGIKAGWMRRLLHQLFEQLEPVPDPLCSLCEWCQETDVTTYLQKLHFPATEDDAVVARRRLALDELLVLLEQAQQTTRAWQERTPSFSLPMRDYQPELVALASQLPFTLTSDQIAALADCTSDLQATHPMNRLLQGDVGVGKTIVAGLLAQLLVKHGQSICLIAPTNILAEQHLQSLAQQLPDLPTHLVSARTSRDQLPTTPTVFIGTHALLNKFSAIQPALVIYDEQQRFGVSQRGLSTTLHHTPHVLTMTATPIPRSLMLTVFSHLSRSIIASLPAGRKATKTWYIPQRKQDAGWQWVADQLGRENQLALVVCPFIEASDAAATNQVAAAETSYQELRSRFPQLRIGLLHGKQALELQQATVAQAHAGELDILVATTIVEVGVDLPQAAIMVIQSAERFGLASLHQLRGRVGRRGQQGYCLLMTSASSSSAAARLQQFAQLTTGAEVAELDLSLRGPGDLLGTDQHGYELFTYASWVDTQLLATAQSIAKQLPDPYQSPLFTPKQTAHTIAHN